MGWEGCVGREGLGVGSVGMAGQGRLGKVGVRVVWREGKPVWWQRGVCGMVVGSGQQWGKWKPVQLGGNLPPQVAGPRQVR